MMTESVSDRTIDRIEEYRSQNNLLWMDILRIAIKASPVETRKVLKQINENDVVITGLLKELADT